MFFLKTPVREGAALWMAAVLPVVMFLSLPALAGNILPVSAKPSITESSITELSMREAIALAIARDPWLDGSRHLQSALDDEAVVAATLPDPKLSLTAANLPADTFDIQQEPMTQFSVGLSQAFPRGKTRSLSARHKQQLASQQPLLREDRRAKVSATVAQLWLDVYQAAGSVQLLTADRDLFEQLVDVAEAGYTSAHGRSRQQDVIRAQLELTQLDDRLTQLRQQQEMAQQRLAEWIGVAAARLPSALLPEQGMALPTDAIGFDSAQQLQRHPAVMALDRKLQATATEVDLARQKYQPEWGLSAQYGYRDDDPLGRDRADLFSVGVTFDLPLFTGNRQDREVSAAHSRAEIIRTDKILLLRQMSAQLETALRQWQRLSERHMLYQQQLLPQMAVQAQASLTAYNNDDGDFAEAVRARIAELNAKIDALAIAVERRKILAQINYLSTRTADAHQANSDY